MLLFIIYYSLPSFHGQARWRCSTSVYLQLLDAARARGIGRLYRRRLSSRACLHGPSTRFAAGRMLKRAFVSRLPR